MALATNFPAFFNGLQQQPLAVKCLRSVDAFEMARTGIGREAVGAEAVRRDLEAVGTGCQPRRCGFVAMLSLIGLRDCPT
jgi:hypothetical protein